MQLRTQIPFGCNDSSDWGNSNFYPNPEWGTFGSDDYPTVQAHQTGTKSSITRTVEFWDGSQYSMPSANGCSGYNIDRFYKARSVSDNPYYIKHRTGDGANWIYGHQGPASANTTRMSFQRNVIGFSWEYQTGGTNSAGLSPKNVLLLYRKREWTGKFFGVWLIKNESYASSTRRQHYGNKLWDDIPDYRAKRSGKVSINLVTSNNAIAKKVLEEDMCFQGIWFEMRTNDSGASQYEGNYHYMWNCRLIYDDHDPWNTRDDSTRIVLPRSWEFQSAFNRQKPLRLT